MDTKEEYLALREELLHLDTIVNNTINFFYVFMASYLAFAFTQSDTILFLIAYIAIIPPYLIALSKMEGICRIGAYLEVYHEGNDDREFKWETKNSDFKNSRPIKLFNHMISTNFPFLFGSTSVMFLHIYKFLVLEKIATGEIIKLAISVLLFFSMVLMVFKYRNISTELYVKAWKEYEDTLN